MGQSPQRSPTPGNIRNRSTNSYGEESYDENDSFNFTNETINFTHSGDESREIIRSESKYLRIRESKRPHIKNFDDSGDGFSPNSSYGITPEKKRILESRNVETSNIETSSDFPWSLVFIVLIIVSGLFVWYIAKSQNTNQTKRIECPQFRELSKDFINQDIRLWKSLKSNIEDVVNQTPDQPGVFLLAYNDVQTSKIIMTKILNATANCMKSKHPIKLEGGSFVTDVMIKDYGEIIIAYRKQLESEGIMYVEDIQKVPAQAAQAFHTICDTITPLVKKSVIFFTMYVNEYDVKMTSKELHRVVETELETKWIDIDHNTLGALIGRVTDQVFFLRPENSLHNW